MPKLLTFPGALVAATLALTGCSDDPPDTAGSSNHSDHSGSPSSHSQHSGSPAPSTQPSPTRAPAGTTVDITIKGGKIIPNGDRVTAKVGRPITLKIDADTAGEIHVHSTPERKIAYAPGTSTKTLTIDQPGIVDVEDHGLGQVIVQIQAS